MGVYYETYVFFGVELDYTDSEFYKKWDEGEFSIGVATAFPMGDHMAGGCTPCAYYKGTRRGFGREGDEEFGVFPLSQFAPPDFDERAASKELLDSLALEDIKVKGEPQWFIENGVR